MQFTNKHFYISRSTLFFIGMALLLAFMIFMPVHAFASEGTGGGLPFEAPLVNLKNSLTGPVAFTVSIIGIVVAGAVLIFGGDLNGFVRTLVFLVLVIAIIVGANTLMSGLFNKGAEIALNANETTLVMSTSRKVAES